MRVTSSLGSACRRYLAQVAPPKPPPTTTTRANVCAHTRRANAPASVKPLARPSTCRRVSALTAVLLVRENDAPRQTGYLCVLTHAHLALGQGSEVRCHGGNVVLVEPLG